MSGANDLVLVSGANDRDSTLGECLERGEVWLHIETDEEQVLRSECVGTPSSGTAALEAAEVDTVLAEGGYLCTLSGYPESCPRTFDGQYWQYSHAKSLDADWTFSTLGAADHEPEPGSILGWCYNDPDEDRCELPTLAADQQAVDRIDISADPGGLSAYVVIPVLVVLVVAAWWLYRRRGDVVPE